MRFKILSTWFREIFVNISKKNIIPLSKQAIILSQENSPESLSIDSPLDNNIIPAKVQTIAASRSSPRLDIVSFLNCCIFIVIDGPLILNKEQR